MLLFVKYQAVEEYEINIYQLLKIWKNLQELDIRVISHTTKFHHFWSYTQQVRKKNIYIYICSL